MALDTGDAPTFTPTVQPIAPSVTSKPVKAWAFVGGLFVCLTVYCWVAWVLSGDARPTPRGPSSAPHWQVVSARIWEFGLAAGALILAYHFVVKPWRRERRLTLDGMLLLIWVQLWALQDPWINYTVQVANYSSILTNLGCPQCHVPGWQSPNGANMTEPLLWGPGAYVCGLFTVTLLCNAVMRRAKQRWPQLGTLGLVGIAIGFCALVDLTLELSWIWSGLYHMGGGIRSFTIFHGRWYQLPLNEVLLWGLTWGLLSSLRYFRDDKGRTYAERGIDEMRLGQARATGLRGLALCGVMNTLFLVGFNVPQQWFSTHADSFPASVIDKSYLTNMMCGPATQYACPGPRVPIAVGRDSGHATPEGTFRAPAGLPIQVQDR